ncbi:PROTEIN PHOSPHATASE 2C [Salix viminalis]|uniref:PROTEIN PHOSPHATASE 2C n=1 Tax=Salix viminalis TaxID=40686 RepID=A0A9Q0NQ51_SALVM|nr:PROTEIN PHOSPHATASE 2C [Salix viminalis]
MIEGLIWSPRGSGCHEQPDDWAFEEGPHSDFSGPTSGCTACVAIIRNNQLIVANAGDSRCVISRKGQAYNLSRDHKPDLEAEKERILKAGGFIHAGRVNGSLNLSRAIGDPIPDINTVELCDDDEFLVLACDGIWDCMSSQQLVDFSSRTTTFGKQALCSFKKPIGSTASADENSSQPEPEPAGAESKPGKV